MDWNYTDNEEIIRERKHNKMKKRNKTLPGRKIRL
jgi:hypothetical protein